jgi:hypothetical protein
LEWGFATGPFKVDSKEKAFEEGYKVLHYLSGNPVAELLGHDCWGCFYETGSDYYPIAMQGEHCFIGSPYKIRQFLSK